MNLGAMVLAAGHSSRFGANKLLAPFRGGTMLGHVLDAARAAPVGRRVLICRSDLEFTLPPGVERLELASQSMAASLKAGLALLAGCDGVFVFLGDMPCIPHALSGELARALGDRYAAFPTYQGRQGHPVLFARRAFADLALLTGDRGAGAMLRTRDDVAQVSSGDPGVLRDVDTPGDLQALEG